MTKPLICLSARESFINQTRIFYDNESYFEYVRAGGGIPVMAGCLSDEDAERIAAQCDGLIVTGGEDCDPAYYGEENTYSAVIAHDIEEADLRLYRAFAKAGKPVLGICRGIQLINIAEGGTLIQDIPKETEHTMNHNQRNMDPPLPVGTTAHKVKFEAGSVLHSIFSDEYEVNTYHHQAIKDTAPGFTVTALSTDGIIEGIEKENVTAVQWHPERLLHYPGHKGLIEWFVSQCSAQQS